MHIFYSIKKRFCRLIGCSTLAWGGGAVYSYSRNDLSNGEGRSVQRVGSTIDYAKDYAKTSLSSNCVKDGGYQDVCIDDVVIKGGRDPRVRLDLLGIHF